MKRSQNEDYQSDLRFIGESTKKVVDAPNRQSEHEIRVRLGPVHKSTGPVGILSRVQFCIVFVHVTASQQVQCICICGNISTGPMLLCTGPKPFP